MAKQNYQKEVLAAYNRAKKQVGRSLDGKYISRMEFVPSYMAAGFGAAYEKATKVKYGSGINTKANWEETLKELNYDIIAAGKPPKSKGATATKDGKNLSEIFEASLSNKIVDPTQNRMAGAHIENGSRSTFLSILLQSKSDGGPQRQSIARQYRDQAWEYFNKTHETAAKLSKQSMGQQTPYEHMDPSTAGGDALQFFNKELEHGTNQALQNKADIVTGYLGAKQKATVEKIETLLLGALGKDVEWAEEEVFDEEKGKFKTQRIVTGRIGSLATNSKIAQKTDPDNLRKALKAILIEQFKNIAPLDRNKAADFEASDSIKQKAKIATILTATNKFRKNKRTKVTTTNKKKLKKRGTRGSKINPKRTAHSIRNTAVAGTSVKKKRSKQQKPAQSGLELKNLINAMLPDELLKQMGSPRLNNRTGRFRRSARVTNVTIGPRGGTNIDYTYQLDPYQTFEPGGAMGSTNRDPRSLIGLSIREIAQELMGNKFIKTRRV